MCPPQHPKYWMSLVWAGAVVTRAKKEGRISDQFAFQTIITEINKFRSGCGGLLDYDWISVPLVYTQVSFFLRGVSHSLATGGNIGSLHLLCLFLDGPTIS